MTRRRGRTLEESIVRDGEEQIRHLMRRDRMTPCVDCGGLFDSEDDEARCPASEGTAYHRSEEDAR